MRKVLNVAADILREATTRRWLQALWLIITLAVLLLTLALRLEVAEGVLAGAHLFGGSIDHELKPPDMALQPVFVAGAWIMFVGGTLFCSLSCSDFAPELLAPGRIEQLLALPLRRSELVLGTYLGVLSIATLVSLYTGLLFTLLLGMKSGVWSLALLGAALASSVAFAAVYGAMLAGASLVRSAALSAALGGTLFVVCCTFTTPTFATLFSAGTSRQRFEALISWLPRLDLLGQLGPALAGSEPLPAGSLRALLGTLSFGLACVALAIWSVERKDF